MQEAINEITYFMDRFPEIASFQIIDNDNIRLHFNMGKGFRPKDFPSSIELKDWCEENLEMKG